MKLPLCILVKGIPAGQILIDFTMEYQLYFSTVLTPLSEKPLCSAHATQLYSRPLSHAKQTQGFKVKKGKHHQDHLIKIILILRPKALFSTCAYIYVTLLREKNICESNCYHKTCKENSQHIRYIDRCVRTPIWPTGTEQMCTCFLG